MMNTRMAAAAIGGAAFLLLSSCATPPPPRAGLDKIQHIVVIYAENRSFDHLYGLFPGANGIANATSDQYTQVDRDSAPLSKLPPVWKTSAPGQPNNVPDPAFPTDLPNRPFRIDSPPINLP